METMGKKGLQEVAMQNAQKAAYAASEIAKLDGYSLPFSAPRFNEFVVRGSKPASNVLESVRQKGVIGGLALSKYYTGHDSDFVVAVTETNSKEQIDSLVEALRK
jgi:glycine dehydrogenase subunit 1